MTDKSFDKTVSTAIISSLIQPFAKEQVSNVLIPPMADMLSVTSPADMSNTAKGLVEVYKAATTLDCGASAGSVTEAEAPAEAGSAKKHRRPSARAEKGAFKLLKEVQACSIGMTGLTRRASAEENQAAAGKVLAYVPREFRKEVAEVLANILNSTYKAADLVNMSDAAILKALRGMNPREKDPKVDKKVSYCVDGQLVTLTKHLFLLGDPVEDEIVKENLDTIYRIPSRGQMTTAELDTVVSDSFRRFITEIKEADEKEFSPVKPLEVAMSLSHEPVVVLLEVEERKVGVLLEYYQLLVQYLGGKDLTVFSSASGASQHLVFRGAIEGRGAIAAPNLL